MTLNTEAAISALVNSVRPPAFAYARSMMVVTPTVSPYNDRQGLAPRVFTEYGAASMRTLSETDDLTSQAFTPSVIATLTPTEVGGQYFVTDSRAATDYNDVIRDASLELGGAFAEKMESDLIGLFSSLTGGTVGAAGTVITWDYVYGMMARLVANHAPAPYTLVLHPYQAKVLFSAASVAGTYTNAAPELLNAVNRQFFQGSVSGINIYVSPYLTIDTNGDARIAMYARDAIALDVRDAARIRPQRDESRRGVELNMVGTYGYSVKRPTFGVQGLFDATTPG